jgi:hypothetical protein
LSTDDKHHYTVEFTSLTKGCFVDYRSMANEIYTLRWLSNKNLRLGTKLVDNGVLNKKSWVEIGFSNESPNLIDALCILENFRCVCVHKISFDYVGGSRKSLSSFSMKSNEIDLVAIESLNESSRPSCNFS